MNREDVILSFFASLLSKRRPKQQVFYTVGRLISKLNMKSVRNAALNLVTILRKKRYLQYGVSPETKYPIPSMYMKWMAVVSYVAVFSTFLVHGRMCMTKPQNKLSFSNPTR